jgi:transposase
MPAIASIREIRDIPRERSRLEAYVPVEHPLRRVRTVVDAPLSAMHEWLRLTGAPPVRCDIEPEQMVRALLLQMLFSMRRDRHLVDQIWYSMLFRWFVGLRIETPKWEIEAFTSYREHLIKYVMVRDVLLTGLTEANRQGLLSTEALSARHSELAQFTCESAFGVGQPGELPGDARMALAQHACDCAFVNSPGGARRTAAPR